MIKPEKLKKGDTVAVVSLSSGMLGEPKFIHKLDIAQKRLKEEFGLNVVTMPNTLKGCKFLYEHPEARAQDLMDAFSDKTIKAIICDVGGSDTIRLLPYIDFDIIKNNPKIFTGFSDSTINHLMCYKAGIVSFYGPNIMCNFGEYVNMFEYEKEAIKKVFFEPLKKYEILASPTWSKVFVPWGEENVSKVKSLIPNFNGYEILQGTGTVTGTLFGGCIEVLPMAYGTKLWPDVKSFKDKILFLETSEAKIDCDQLAMLLRGMAAQGIFQQINGIIVGKPQSGTYFEEYKQVWKDVVGFEANRPDMPIIYNVNFGHASPINIIPYGVKCELNCENKTITILENMVK